MNFRIMRLPQNKVRFRKRISFLNEIIPGKVVLKCYGGCPLVLIFFLQFVLLLFGAMVDGEVISASNYVSVSTSLGLSFNNLGAFVIIYSAIPHFATTKSIRNGKEVEDELSFANTTFISSIPFPINSTNQSSPLPNGVDSDSSSNSTLFSSRTLLTSNEDNSTASTLSPSEEMEVSLDISSDEERKREKERMNKGDSRLKRQMGIAAEIALIAPALQTMGCIPKFFCGLNSKPPTRESTALNDLAYLIKFAMLDDDETDVEDPLFDKLKSKNNRGKDGLTRIKEDLILENMAEEELIQEDPANLAFVWKDMEHRIKTKPNNNKYRIDDIMDEIIIEPEQTAVGSLFTNIKSALRIGRSVDHVLSRTQDQGNVSSQVEPRLFGRGRRKDQDETKVLSRRRLSWRQRFKKQPFWTTPQFRQDMELAERIGKTEQDEGKCSTTFNICPYTVHEMMEIVHGGYRKKRKEERRKKKRPEFYINAEGPPKESSEEDEVEATRKPFKDKDNLVTTTTEKTHWYPNDPENQIYYAMFPHKAVEQGITTVPTTTTRKPHVAKNKAKYEDLPETVYDIGPHHPIREHRRPQMKIQGHVDYENDEGSMEEKKPEHLDMMIHNKKDPHQPSRKPWWNILGGGGNQRPPPQQHNNHQRPHQAPGRRPRPPGMDRPSHQHPFNQPNGFGGVSKEENNKSGNGEDDIEDSSEEHGKLGKKKKKKGLASASDSAEDEDDNGGSSEEKSTKEKIRRVETSTPPPPSPPPPSPAMTVFKLPLELQGENPNIHILGIQMIENGGDLVPTGLPQQYQSPQPLQPFFQDAKLKQSPISLPRPKYTIQKERRRKKRRKFLQTPPPPNVYGAQQQPQQSPPKQEQAPEKPKPEKTKKENDKSNEGSDEGENEESQENSSEEKTAKVKEASNPPSQSPRGPTLNVILHGRPSEELREAPKQHEQRRPHPGGNNRESPQSSASAEDDLDNSDEENKNSNSAAVDPNSNEMSLEMAKIPDPARPPHHFRNTSNEYTYSDENDGHPPGFLRRPINYSYFKRRPGDQHNNNRPTAPGQQQQGQHNEPPPQSSTQKYSTGFLSFLFGNDKKQKRRPGSMENRPPQNSHQYQQHLPPNNSDEDDNLDDDDEDEDSSEERNTPPKRTVVTVPEGKYEIGYLANKPPPKSIIPDFRPPQRPQRPYRGSTSMEDSDEKRGRSTPSPPTTTQQTTTASPKPLIFVGNPYKTFIPPPATPPQRTPSPPTTEVVSPKKPTKDSDEDEPESDEEKASDESKEDDEDKSSEEETETKILKKKATKDPNEAGPREKEKSNIPLPPVVNYHPSSVPSTASSTTRRPVLTKKSPSKNRDGYGDSSDEKQQGDDSNQTKEEDSDEGKNNDEDSDEHDGSSEEQKKKKQSSPSPPRQKPEDDELEHPSAQFPPQRPVSGDIAAIGEILGAPDEDTEDEPEPYGGHAAGDIPAAPPLALNGFASSLEIMVPASTKPAPLQAPPGVPLQQFYQGNNPLTGGGAPPAGPGAPPAGPGAPPVGPGAPLAPGQQQPAPVNPTSLLGLAQQAGTNNNNPGGGQGGQGGAPAPVREPSDQAQQIQQGLRNPVGQTSNRGQGNRRPGQQNQQGQQGQQGQQNNRRRPQQQGNRDPEEGNEDSSQENSSEEGKSKESSEEKENKSTNNEDGFDESILSLGQKEDADEDEDDKPEKDLVKEPPPPPPIFTGSAEQKIQRQKPFLPRPITPQPAHYYRPKPGRREPILKNQLKPTQILQLSYPQQIHPPPVKKTSPHYQQQQQQHHLVLPMRPSAAANLRPLTSQNQRPPSSISSSFGVSHLLRPLLPRPRPAIRKPLDQKVVQWIRETYGIPDLSATNNNHHQGHMHDPNRSGLSEDSDKNTKYKSSATTKSPSKSNSKKGQKLTRNKTTKAKASSSKRKTTTEKSRLSRGSSESRNSGETTTSFTTSTIKTTTAPTTTTTTIPTTTSTTTTSTTTSTTTIPTTASTTIPTTTSTTTTTTSTKVPSSSAVPPTTRTTASTTTTAKTEKTTITSHKKFSPDYITQEQEAKMAQALFSSEEDEPEEEEQDSDEEEDEEAITEKYKTKVKTKVGGTRLVITVKSVVNKNNNTRSKSSPGERTKVKHIEKIGKVPGKFSFSSKEKLKFSSKEASKFSSIEKRWQDKHKLKSKSSEVIDHLKKSGSAETMRKTPPSTTKIHQSKSKHGASTYPRKSPSTESTKVETTTIDPIFELGLRSTPKSRSKPIKLPPIYGKHVKRKG